MIGVMSKAEFIAGIEALPCDTVRVDAHDCCHVGRYEYDGVLHAYPYGSFVKITAEFIQPKAIIEREWPLGVG